MKIHRWFHAAWSLQGAGRVQGAPRWSCRSPCSLQGSWARWSLIQIILWFYSKAPSYALHYLCFPNSSRYIGKMTTVRLEPHLWFLRVAAFGQCHLCWWWEGLLGPSKSHIAPIVIHSRPWRVTSIMSQAVTLNGNYVALPLVSCDLGQSRRAPDNEWSPWSFHELSIAN